MLEESQKNYSDEIELPQKIVKEIEEVVKERRLSKKEREILESEVKKAYLKKRFEPGETMGIISAQSISEPATQMTMRTYHFAGIAGIKVTYGLPRLIEIFDAKKELETPQMTIYLKKEFNTASDAANFAESIVEKKVASLIKRISLNLNENSIEIELLEKRKTDMVIKAIKEKFKDLHVRVKQDTIVITTKSPVDVKELQKYKERILNLHVAGIEKISNALVRKEGENWIINTIGTNLEAVLKLKEVDARKTFSNNIYEVANVLGIEAARNVIIEEALKTIHEQALNIDTRFIMLVADIMTFGGEINSIGRYGVAGAKTSILARAAFEETIKHLVRASVRNEVDNLQGIFENVMIGQVSPSGTGMFDLIAKFEEEK